MALDRVVMDGDPSTVESLLLAWRNLPRAELPAPNSDGSALVWLDQIGRERNMRPDGWQDRLAPFLSSPRAYIQQLAVRCIPEQEPDHWAPLLMPLLKDQDESVRLNAVVHAGRCKHMSLLSALRQAMNDRMTNQFAAESITAIAGREAGVMAWIDQLEFGTIPYGASLDLCLAWHTLTGEGLIGGWKDGEPSATQRKEQAEKLRRFVAAHREAIDRGLIGPPDATWPSDLLPENWYVQLPDNKIWPVERGDKKK